MMQFWPFVLSVLLMISMPLALAVLIQRRREPGWALFGIGAVTFVLSQVLHIPFNWLVQQRFALLPTDLSVFSNLLATAVFLGLSAGVFEEVARYLAFRHWAQDARTWGKGLMLGAGHGGIESIIVGVLAGINYVAIAAIDRGTYWGQIPDEMVPLVEQQVTAVLALPWYDVMLGALERAFSLCAHLSFSLLVMQVFLRGQRRWLLAAICWHALGNAIGVVLIVQWNAYVAELGIGIFALLSVGIIFWLRTPEPVEPELEPLPPPPPLQKLEPDTTAESLERSKYS